jgi:hypothetical protein
MLTIKINVQYQKLLKSFVDVVLCQKPQTLSEFANTSLHCQYSISQSFYTSVITQPACRD